MPKPRLTFFCELNSDTLMGLFEDPSVMEDLKTLEACLSLGMLDFSPERAEVVHRLNREGIPLIAWLLLPENQGYWFNLDNAAQAHACYDAFQQWTVAQGLVWAGVGMDIEPDIREMKLLTAEWWRLLPQFLRRAFDRRRYKLVQVAYAELVEQARTDGYSVESYQFPFIVDERIVGSTLLQRIAGLVDLEVDKEVLMLYSSFLRPYGAGAIWSYGRSCYLPQCNRRLARMSSKTAIGVGSTGGGVDLGLGNQQPLTWDEFRRDLRLAWRWFDEIYIFSLEGCVRQGFLSSLKSFQWDAPILVPAQPAHMVARWRKMLRAFLWVSAHPFILVISLLSSALLFNRLRNLRSGNE